MSAVDEQLVSQKGRPGRKSSTAPIEESIYMPSRMDQLLSHVQLLPDPDDVWRKGLLSYRDLYSLTRDAHASSCLDQRKSQPMSRAIRVVSRKGASGETSEKALKTCAKTIDSWGMDRLSLICNMMDAKFMGMQPFELNWRFDSEVNANILAMPRDLLQEWFAYTPDGHLRVVKPGRSWGYVAFVNDTDPVPPFKVFNLRHESRTRNPYGRKLLTPCYWPVTFKRGGMRFFAEYAERFGMPTVQVKAPANTSSSKLTAFVNGLRNMMRMGVVSFSGEYDVSNLDMDSKYQTTHLYNSFLDAMDKEMSKALLGQTLTTDEGGSRAQGDIHKQILETLWKGDDAFLAKAITDLLDLITFVNYGPEAVGPIAVVGEQLGLERLERDKVLRDFHGIEFTPEYLSTHYDLGAADYVRVDPLKASYKELPDSNVAQGKGGNRPSEAAKTTKEKRDNHRNR